MCKYYLDCKTTCTLKTRSLHSCKSNEIVLWEDADEKKLFCVTCGSTRVEKKFKPCTYFPFARTGKFYSMPTCPYAKAKTEKVYLILV